MIHMKQQVTKTRVAVAIGGNMGNRRQLFLSARDSIMELGTQFKFSSIYETRPVDSPSTSAFFNAVISFSTTLPAMELLRALQAIEISLGRERLIPNQARTLDLDLLIFGSLVSRNPELTVPHPRMTQRMFVMLPLLETWAAHAVLPGFDLTLAQLIKKTELLDTVSQPTARYNSTWEVTSI